MLNTSLIFKPFHHTIATLIYDYLKPV